MLVGGLEGEISIYDLNKPGKEKYINYVNQLGVATFGKTGIKEVGFNIGRKQVYVEHLGSVNVIEAMTGKSVDSFVVTSAELCQFRYYDKTDMMVAISSDNSVKVLAMTQEVRDSYVANRVQRIETFRQNHQRQSSDEDGDEE